MGERYYNPPSLFEQIRCPHVNKAYIKEKLRLPEQFLGACTLKEGTFVTIIILQCVAVAFVGYVTSLMYYHHDDLEYYWKNKWKADFDPYIENEEKDLINTLWPLWDPVTRMLIFVHAIYFIFGLGVCYGLCNKNAHPIVYIPWLILTGILVAGTFFTAFCMLVGIIIFAHYRYISVTWDWVPLVITVAYGVFWFYGFVTVIAHYQRRQIVRYWKMNKEKDPGY